MTEIFVKPCGVAVEGLYFLEQPDLDRDEWRIRAEARAARLWQALGRREATVAHRSMTLALHAVRTYPRGSRRQRDAFDRMTECGQFLAGGYGWVQGAGTLGQVTCLVCRTVVRERYEQELENGSEADELLDEYDRNRYDLGGYRDGNRN